MNFLYKDHHLNQFCLLIIEHFEAKLCCPLLPENKGWLRIRLGESVRAGVALPGIAYEIGWFDGALFCDKGCPEFVVPFTKLLNPLMVIV